MNSRISSLLSKLGQGGLDGLIVSLPANISYLTKYLSRDSYFLVSKQRNVYFTDSRYIQEAKLALRGVSSLKEVNGSAFKLIADSCMALGLRRIGFEERYLPFAEYQKIKQYLGKSAGLEPTHSLIEELRQVKDEQELSGIKQAVEITAKAFKYIEKFIAPGMREIEVAGEIERFIRYEGAQAASFDIIVGSGPNSGFPHHITSSRKLRRGEPVLIDMGVDYAGYKSDLTRVYFLGKIKVRFQKVYQIVLGANIKAIKAIKPKAKIAEIDRVSREYIKREGYGSFFGHSLGHGVGLEIHEAPHISGKEEGRLCPGMVFTVEPAIYLPGEFGIRIEDMVLVTEKGCEVLSGAVHK